MQVGQVDLLFHSAFPFCHLSTRVKKFASFIVINNTQCAFPFFNAEFGVACPNRKPIDIHPQPSLLNDQTDLAEAYVDYCS